MLVRTLCVHGRRVLGRGSYRLAGRNRLSGFARKMILIAIFRAGLVFIPRVSHPACRPGFGDASLLEGNADDHRRAEGVNGPGGQSD